MSTGSATIIGPLTTTFIAPPDCDYLSVNYQSVDEEETWLTTVTKYDPAFYSAARCFPPGYPLGKLVHGAEQYYSPGVCPHRWTSYLYSVDVHDRTTAQCCPPGFVHSTGNWCIQEVTSTTTVTAVIITGTNLTPRLGGTVDIRTFSGYVLPPGKIYVAPPFNIMYQSGDFAITSPGSTTPTSTPTPNHTTPASNAGKTNEILGLSNGAKIGIGVAVPLIFITCAIIFGFCFIRRRNRPSPYPKDEGDNTTVKGIEDTGNQSNNDSGDYEDKSTAQDSIRLINHLPKSQQRQVRKDEAPNNRTKGPPLVFTRTKPDPADLPGVPGIGMALSRAFWKELVGGPRPPGTADQEAQKTREKAIRDSNALIYGDSVLSPQLNEIRVAVFPPCQQMNDDITCTLSTIPIDSTNTGYMALSYCWGDACDVLPITINGKEFLATRNLVAAIRHIRSPTKDTVVWIDAISIKQADNGEKIHQLARMRDIYQSALRTLVWLGRNTKESDETLDNLNGIVGKAIDTLGEKSASPNSSEKLDKLAAMNIEHRTNLLTATLKTAQVAYPDTPRTLRDIVRRDWFRRLWIVQEAIMGKNPLAIIGRRSIPLCILTELFRLSLKTGQRESQAFSADQGNIAALEFYKYHVARGTKIELKHWLWMYGMPQQCSNPRDRIFALLGLASDRNERILKAIQHYQLPESVIYERTTEHIVSKSQDLDFICWGRGPGRAKDLPSWVPDFRLGYVDSPISLTSVRFERGEDFVAGGPIDFQPGDEIPEHMNKTVAGHSGLVFLGNSLLEVHGLIIDAVKDIGEAYSLEGVTVNHESGEISIPPEALRHHHAVLDETIVLAFENGATAVAEKLKPYPRGGSTYFDAYSRTLVCDHGMDGKRCKPGQGFFNLQGPSNLTPYSHISLASQDSSFKTENLQLHSWRVRRSFMRSELGLMGLVPHDTKPKDLICVLFGCSVPVILRPGEKVEHDGKLISTFTFIGECYVHGIMDGEALADLLHQRVLPMTFCLK